MLLEIRFAYFQRMFEISASWLPSVNSIFIAIYTSICLGSLRTILKRRDFLRRIDYFPSPSNLQVSRLRILGGAASLLVGHLIMEGHASLSPFAKPADPDALSPLSPWLLVKRIVAFFTLNWFQIPSESKEQERFFTIRALSYMTSWITSYMGDSFFWRYWFVLLPALTALSISTVALIGRAFATKFDFIKRIPALVVEHRHVIRGMVLAPLSSVFLADSLEFFQMNEFSMCCAYGCIGMACAAFAMEDFDPSRRINRWTRYLPSIYLLILSLINLIQDGPSLLFLAAIVSCWATSVETNIFPNAYSVLMQLFGLALFPIATQGIVVFDDSEMNLILNLVQLLSVVLVLAPMFITDAIEKYMMFGLDLALDKIPDVIFNRLVEPVFFQFVPFIYRKIRYGTFFSRMAKRFYGKFIKPVLNSLVPVVRFILRAAKLIVEIIASWVKQIIEKIASWVTYIGNKIVKAGVATANGAKAVVMRIVQLIRTYIVDPTVALAKTAYNEGIVPVGNLFKRFFIYLFETYMVPVAQAMRKRVILFANLFVLYLCLQSSVMSPSPASLMSLLVFFMLAGGLLASAFGLVYLTKKQGPHSSVFWALFNIRVSVIAMVVGFMYKGYLGTALVYSLFNCHSKEPPFSLNFDKDSDSFISSLCIAVWLVVFRVIVAEKLVNAADVVAVEHRPKLKAATSTLVRGMWLFNLIQQLLQQVNSTRVSMNFAAEYATSSSVDHLASPYYVIARHAVIGIFTVWVLRFMDSAIGAKVISEDLDQLRQRLPRRNQRPANMTRWEWFWEFVQTTYLQTAFGHILFVLSGLASFPFPDANFFHKLTLLRASVGHIQIAFGLNIYAQNAASPRWKSALSRPLLGLLWFRRVFYYYSRPVLAFGTSLSLVWSAQSRINDLRATGTDGFTILWGGLGSIGQLVAAFQFLSVGVIVIGDMARSDLIREKGCQMFDKIEVVVRKIFDVLELLLNFSERISRIMKKLGENLLQLSMELWRQLCLPFFKELVKGFTFIWSNAAASWIASVSTIGLLYLIHRNGLDETILNGLFGWISLGWNLIPSLEPISTTMGAGRFVGQVAMSGINAAFTETKQWLFDLQDGRIFQNTGFVWALNVVCYAIAFLRLHRTADAGYVLGPFLTLTISIMFFNSGVFATLVGCMVWGILGVIVAYVDRRERRLAQEHFHRMQRHPQSNKTMAEILMGSLPKESEVKKIFKAEDCAFCYEKLEDDVDQGSENDQDNKTEEDTNQNNSMQVSTLPCGHQFHYGCVQKWFESSNRCPICREPADKNHLLFQSMF